MSYIKFQDHIIELDSIQALSKNKYLDEAEVYLTSQVNYYYYISINLKNGNKLVTKHRDTSNARDKDLQKLMELLKD